jgi:hypothetical protein
MKAFILTIYQGSRVLFYTGLMHLLLIFAFFILYSFDAREVNYENTWLKPLRFAISIWLFTWTYAWFSSFTEKYRKLFNFLNHLIAICMIIEITLISFQAGRGVASHFNVAATFDAMIFSVMGAVIGLNAAVVGVWFMVFTFWEKQGGIYRSSIIWGMAIFLLGNFSGYLIIRYEWPADLLNSYSKIPFTGWKDTLKDLKISHAIGLHAIQVLPVSQLVIKRIDANKSGIHVVGITYLVLYFIALLYSIV